MCYFAKTYTPEKFITIAAYLADMFNSPNSLWIVWTLGWRVLAEFDFSKFRLA